MEKKCRQRLAYFGVQRSHICYFIFFFSISIASSAQQKTQDGQTYALYKPGHFKPGHGLAYSVFVSPVLTVDPMGFGGKSTYALGAGARINLWESKTPDNLLQGLKIKGLYTAFGYEYYPQQYDKLYASLWLRIKTFMPIAARVDKVLDIGETVTGSSLRVCFGFEVKSVTVFLCGVTGFSLRHPDNIETHYANSGAVMVIVPVYNHSTRKNQ